MEENKMNEKIAINFANGILCGRRGSAHTGDYGFASGLIHVDVSTLAEVPQYWLDKVDSIYNEFNEKMYDLAKEVLASSLE